jgi:superfamily II DNA or RNA helicase
MDRKHQIELREAIRKLDETDLPINILAHVVPGGGKSRLPGIMAEEFTNYKIGWFVPRDSLRVQAVQDMKRDFDIILRDSGNDVDPTHGLRGFVTTHQALLTDPDLWVDEIRRKPYVVIIDECHHAKLTPNGESRALSNALLRLKDTQPSVWLNMTGTLDTNDNALIYGMEYDTVPKGLLVSPEKSSDIFIRYDRKDALMEKAIVPIEFYHHDGVVKWANREGEQDPRRLSVVERDEESAAIFTALNSALAIQLFEKGIEHWRNFGRKLLIVTYNQAQARDYYRRLGSKNITVGLAISDNANAQEQILDFKEDTEALVTCQMAYEGLDVPDLTHVICLTHIRSVPWIEQMLGRVWRQTPKNLKRQCWAFVPDDPRMNRVIELIAKEQTQVIGLAGGGGPGGGPAFDVLALEGEVDAIRQALLDGEIMISEENEKLTAIFADLKSRYSEEAIRQIFARLFPVPTLSKRARTPAQEESDLSKQIHTRCSEIDNNKGLTWGTTQKALFRRLGNKSTTVMNKKELINAKTILENELS